jgi:hypothetical protein
MPKVPADDIRCRTRDWTNRPSPNSSASHSGRIKNIVDTGEATPDERVEAAHPQGNLRHVFDTSCAARQQSSIA